MAESKVLYPHPNQTLTKIKHVFYKYSVFQSRLKGGYRQAFLFSTLTKTGKNTKIWKSSHYWPCEFVEEHHLYNCPVNFAEGEPHVLD